MDIKDTTHGITVPDQIIPKGDFYVADANNIGYKDARSIENMIDTMKAQLLFDTLEQRDSFPVDLRRQGMLAYVNDTKKTYRLLNGVSNGDWEEETFKTGITITIGDEYPSNDFGEPGDIYFYYKYFNNIMRGE